MHVWYAKKHACMHLCVALRLWQKPRWFEEIMCIPLRGFTIGNIIGCYIEPTPLPHANWLHAAAHTNACAHMRSTPLTGSIADTRKYFHKMEIFGSPVKMCIPLHQQHLGAHVTFGMHICWKKQLYGRGYWEASNRYHGLKFWQLMCINTRT